MTYTRPSKDEYFMQLAKTVATRSTCPKAQVGAVLVRDGSIISTGYNGAPVGEKHCEEAGHNESPDGHCQRAVHAELNAILQAAKHGNATKDSTLYMTHFPCNHCLKALRNAGIVEIKYETAYKNHENFISLNHFKIDQVESNFNIKFLSGTTMNNNSSALVIDAHELGIKINPAEILQSSIKNQPITTKKMKSNKLNKNDYSNTSHGNLA